MNAPLNIPSLSLSSLAGIHSVYFIGIGGIGMSALARYCLSKNMVVSGYDRTRTPLTDALESEGVNIHYQEDVHAVPENIDLVVYTPAVPKNHAELVYFNEHGYKVAKRSDMLNAITTESFNICIAGTHGKTTISTMIAHILRHSGYGCTAFLGGISVNYHTNFWSNENNVCVVEADEYDRSFLKLNPDIAVITSMDADHLDIYGDEESMQAAFVAFAKKIKPGGMLICKSGLRRLTEASIPNLLTYSLQNSGANVFARNIRIDEGGYNFDITINKQQITGFRLHVGGMHNVENTIAAVAVAAALKIQPDKIKAAVATYKGVRRRFEYIIPPAEKRMEKKISPVLIDDYAHHPAELKALLSSVRALFPDRWITIIFQPHLFSRTRDLALEFAGALSLADQVILLPIYPAREMPIEGITSKIILDKITLQNKQVIAKENLQAYLRQARKSSVKSEGGVWVMAGAGDIDTLINLVKDTISESE